VRKNFTVILVAIRYQCINANRCVLLRLPRSIRIAPPGLEGRFLFRLVQFSEGFSIRSMITVSTGPRADSSFSPRPCMISGQTETAPGPYQKVPTFSVTSGMS
jgi:hypothetical protein